MTQIIDNLQAARETVPENHTLVSVEYTDTFGGEANYGWCQRMHYHVRKDESEVAIVRRVKADLGISGFRCQRSRWADTIELRPVGACVVIFISFQY